MAGLRQAGNDLQAPARALLPQINDALAALREASGCCFAAMSGSGATCFGLFEAAGQAERAAAKIAQDHPDWWVASAPLVSDCTDQPADFGDQARTHYPRL